MNRKSDKNRKKTKQYQWKLPEICLPLRIFLYVSTLGMCILSIWQAGYKKFFFPIEIAVYVLAACLLALSVVCLYQDIWHGTIKRISEWLDKNPFTSRFYQDYSYRTILTTVPAVLVSVAYTVYNGVIGIYSHSAWFVTMAFYYSLLGIMRYQAVRTQRFTARMEDKKQAKRKEYAVLKTDGILILLLNLALCGIIILTITKGEGKKYPEVMVISIAAYTFYKITVAILNLIKVRKMKSAILIVIRNIGFADALVSLFSLQITMYASLNESAGIANLMNAVTGLGVGILISLLGASMIYEAAKEKNKMEEHG